MQYKVKLAVEFTVDAKSETEAIYIATKEIAKIGKYGAIKKATCEHEPVTGVWTNDPQQ
jgi:hypothetical protein